MFSTFTLLEGRLYGGSLPRTRVDVDLLYEMGVRTIISLTTFGLAQIDKRFTHIIIDVPDWGIPTTTQVDEFIQAVRTSWERGDPVFVHCYAGCGRTGTMLALVEIFLLGVSDAYKAIDIVRRVRPCAVESQLQEDFVLEQAERGGLQNQ